MNQGREFGWNDSIENDASGFILLDEGDYPFQVLNFKRERFQGSAKLPACNCAMLELEITAPDGTSITIEKPLYLHSKVEGLLCAFFTCIGHRRHGERLIMNWDQVIGASGWLQIKHRKYVAQKGARKGEELTSLDITRWHAPEDFEPPFQSPYEDDQYPQTQQPVTQGNYVPGQF